MSCIFTLSATVWALCWLSVLQCSEVLLGLCGPKEGCSIWDAWEDQVQCWQGTVLTGMGTGASSPTEGLGLSLGCMEGMVSSSHADTSHQPRSTSLV